MQELTNNWLFQSIVSNIVWIIIVAVVNWIRSSPKKEKVEIIKNKEYSKKLIKTQFKISFWFSSASTIFLIIILMNHLQDTIPFLFGLLIFVTFWSYVLMFGAFEGALDYMPDDKFKKK